MALINVNDIQSLAIGSTKDLAYYSGLKYLNGGKGDILNDFVSVAINNILSMLVTNLIDKNIPDDLLKELERIPGSKQGTISFGIDFALKKTGFAKYSLSNPLVYSASIVGRNVLKM